MIDLDAAIQRLYTLGDEQLAELVNKLDAILPDCRIGLADDDVITVAASARILLRQRRAAAGRAQARHIVHDFLDAPEHHE